MSTIARPETVAILSVGLMEEGDIVVARQRARQLSQELGLPNQDQVRIATAVSEIARNAFQYAGSGRVEFSLVSNGGAQSLAVEVSDRGPGIHNLSAVLEGRYESRTGMGLGLVGARRLMDTFHIESVPGRGTTVRFSKTLPRQRPVQAGELRTVVERLAQNRPAAATDEVQRQNRDLLAALESLRNRELDLERRQAELSRLNAELEETNRGVVALYAELDEKAVALRHADELKSRFLSHVSHEFRTPVNSILALSQLLLRRLDGELSSEQDRQVTYIRQAAQDLLEMVNDLLDLAKVEAGKTEVHVARVDVAQLFGALRGIMRPLATNEAVVLVFEEPPRGAWIESDESKIAQILRNLVSNALKFTERGEVRISCEVTEPENRISIAVTDTGIGIAPEDQPRIFQEFTQVRNRLQHRVKGTGLGLPLSRKLADLLGGTLELSSAPGKGSTFTLRLPLAAGTALLEESQPPAVDHGSILIIDDEETARYIARQLFRGTERPIIEAVGGIEGAERARFESPALILLDLIMPDRSGFDVLDDLKSDPATRDIPVVIHTSRILSPADIERLAGRHELVLPKAGGPGREAAMRAIRELLKEPNLFIAEVGAEQTSYRGK